MDKQKLSIFIYIKRPDVLVLINKAACVLVSMSNWSSTLPSVNCLSVTKGLNCLGLTMANMQSGTNCSKVNFLLRGVRH